MKTYKISFTADFTKGKVKAETPKEAKIKFIEGLDKTFTKLGCVVTAISAEEQA